MLPLCDLRENVSIRKTFVVIAILFGNLLWFNGQLVERNAISLSGSSDTAVVKCELAALNASICPPRAVVLNDIGRMGNKFFEYLAVRLQVQVLQSEFFIRKSMADVFDRYFVDRQTPVVNWTFLEFGCNVTESQFVKLPLDHFAARPTTDVAHRWIQFSGDCNCFLPKELLTDFCTGTGYPSNISQTHWNAIFEQRDQLIREFRWRPELRRSVDAQLEQMRATRNCSVIVAVHVRRTDYERYLVRRYGQAKLADSSFFSRAMDHFR